MPDDDDWEPENAHQHHKTDSGLDLSVHDDDHQHHHHHHEEPLDAPDDKPLSLSATSSSRKRSQTNAVADIPRHFDNLLFQLLLFKSETNNYHATKEEQPDLHAFITYIKREYKHYTSDPASSSLTADQVKVLEHLHVPLTSRGDDHWMRFYDLLVKYNETHGHVLVPRLCEVPGLGDWVTDQRRQYKALYVSIV
jgi:hypothetical protein